jgi:hypothetical protein
MFKHKTQLTRQVPVCKTSLYQLITVFFSSSYSRLFQYKIFSGRILSWSHKCARCGSRLRTQLDGRFYSNLRSVIEQILLLIAQNTFIIISGSANYLQNTELTENMVSTTLQFQSTSLTKRLPYGLSPDNGNLCDKVGQEGVEKPTHIVSEIVYGLNAFMQFSISTR